MELLSFPTRAPFSYILRIHCPLIAPFLGSIPTYVGGAETKVVVGEAFLAVSYAVLSSCANVTGSWVYQKSLMSGSFQISQTGATDRHRWAATQSVGVGKCAGPSAGLPTDPRPEDQKGGRYSDLGPAALADLGHRSSTGRARR